MKHYFALFTALLVSGVSAFGYTNVLENATTQVVDSVWNIGSTNLWVGDLTSSNEMSIIHGGSVVNGDGFVGALASASSNTVNVSGSGSWENTGTLQVGTTGNISNRVSVFDGGTVTASNLVIHVGNDFNLDHGGTLAMTGDFDAGQAGFNWNDGSTLTVNQTLTFNDDLTDTNQTLNIDGGSWDRGGNLQIDGVGNTLSILNGGGVTNADGFVGSTVGASNNVVSVSGDGSHWINNGSLAVGNSGSNTANSVSVGAGGLVQADGLSIGIDDAFNLNNGGTLSMTGGFDASLDGFNWNASGTLSVGGVLEGMAADTNVGTYLAGGKQLVLNGGSWLNGSTNLIVGYESSDNTLAITNGGGVANADGYIGWGATAANNSVLVSDAGSAWTNGGNLYVGVYETNLMTAGEGNSLTVSNNAWVFVGGDATNLTAKGSGGIGVAGDSEMLVGSNATVWAGQGIYVGTATSSGTVSVLDGGSVTANALEIDVAGTFNLDGTLTMTGDFDAGQAGFNWNDGSTLTVNQNLTFADLGGTNKTLNVDGGSWDRGGNLQIDGAGNTLVVLNGGGVTNVNGLVGSQVGASNNVVLVSGDGSHWINNGDLSIGNSGSNTANSVTVEDGGVVQADSLSVDLDDAFNLNNGGTLAMTGGFNLAGQSNLNWNTGGNLSVGGLLEGMAVATNLPAADAAYLGDRKVLTLDGGSWLSGESNLVVGLNPVDLNNADLNSLIITNGGAVDNADGYIGWGSSADYNSVVVGAGSAWTNHGGGLYVGKWLDASTNLVDAGVSNSLSVADGGWVFVGEGRTNGPSGGLVVASTNGAELVVGGKGSMVEVEQSLYVGVDSTSTGMVSVASGGMVSVGDLVIATNSTFDLFGTLKVASDFDVDQPGDFIWNHGGTLSIGGALTGLDALDGTNLTLEITAGGTWDTTAITNLYITGVSNTVAITEGGHVTNQTASIGVSSNDWSNTVLVSGTGSVWALTGDLFVNSSNSLALASTGLVSIAGTMTVSNAAVAGSGVVEFGAGINQFAVYGMNSEISTNVLFDGGGGEDTVAITDHELFVDGSLSNRFVNFENLNLTNSLLGGTGMVDAFPNINMSGGWIAPEGMLTIEGVFVATNTTLRVTAGEDSLHATGGLDLSGLLAEVSVSNNVVPNSFNEVILTADGGLNGSAFSSTNFIEHFLLYDFTLTNDLTTVSVVSEAALDGEISSTLAYAGIQGIRAGFNGMQNAAFVRTKQLRRNAVATDHAISHEAYLMSSSTNAPAGPQGPGDKNTIFGMHFWAEQFSGQGDYDAMDLSDGFTLNNNGTSFGFDRLFGDSLVAGINYTYARSATRATAGDRVDTETYWLGLYSEWFGKNDYYLEGLIGLGWSDYETTRIDVGYTGEGTTEGSDFGGHIEAGKYFNSRNWAMAPYAGLHYLGIKSDAYTETDATGENEIAVGEQSVASLESALGVKLRNRFDTRVGRFQTIGYAEWAYDFINDDIESSLSDGTVSVVTARITPNASLLNAGVGFSWICTDYLEVGVGYDGRFNENYEEHMGTIMLDVRF